MNWAAGSPGSGVISSGEIHKTAQTLVNGEVRFYFILPLFTNIMLFQTSIFFVTLYFQVSLLHVTCTYNYIINYA